MHHRNSTYCAAARAAVGSVAVLCLASCATMKSGTSTSELDSRLAALTAYDYGADRAPVARLAAFLTANRSDEVREAIESRLVAFVQRTDATPAARQAVIRELGRVGTVRSAPALLKLVASETFADDAAMALARITDPAMAPALRRALETDNDGARKRVIAVFGQRGDTQSVAAIADNLDGPCALAAVRALGDLGTPEAAKELIGALPDLKGPARLAAWDALLSCHAAAFAGGDPQVAGEIELEFDRVGAPAHVCAAAAARSAQALGDAEKMTRRAALLLASQDPARQATGIGLVRSAADDRVLLALAKSLPTLSPAVQIALVGALADRRLTAANEAVLGLTSSEEPAVCHAALRALGHLGAVGSVDVLLDAATGEDGETRSIARKALRLVAGVGVDERILTVASEPPVSRQVEAITLIGDRGMVKGLPILYACAANTNAVLRAAAIPQFGVLVNVEEWSRFIKLFLATEDEKDLQLLVTAAATAAQRVKNPGGAVTVQLSRTSALPARRALLTLAGRVTADAALPELKRGVTSTDAGVRQAAVRALGNWRTVAALPALKEAASGDDEQLRRLAQRNALEVIRNAAGLDDDTRVRNYREFAPLLGHVDEQRLLLSAVGNLKGVQAVVFAAEFLKQDSVRAEAEAAVIRVAKVSGKPNPATAAVLQRIATQSASEVMRIAARALLEQ